MCTYYTLYTLQYTEREYYVVLDGKKVLNLAQVQEKVDQLYASLFQNVFMH
jgi:hypothetical protein